MRQIFEEIATESGTNRKMEILSNYKETPLLRKVLHLAKSPRVKFYIKQIPTYVKTSNKTPNLPLSECLEKLDAIIDRTYTGNAAISYLTEILENTSEDNAYIIERIIDKDLKIGMGTTNINKIFPKLIEKTPYMGAVPFNPKLIKDALAYGYCYSQIKMDGRYANAIVQSGDVVVESRQGEPTKLGDSKLLTELSKLPDAVYNGEFTIPQMPRYESNGIIASIVDIEGKRETRTAADTAKKIAAFTAKHGDYKKSLDAIRYTVWDTISIDAYYALKSNVPYAKRLLLLSTALSDFSWTNIKLVETTIVNTYEEAWKAFQVALDNGEEGTVLKTKDGIWKNGKPKWQIKMKLSMDIDLKITGFNYGTGKNSDVISSLTCESADGILKTRPTGIKESMMKYITENQATLLNTIVEVKCSGLSQDVDCNYSLLHPVFKSLRNDKSEADRIHQIKKIENAIKYLK